MVVTSQAEIEQQVIETVEGQLESIVRRLAAEVDRRALFANPQDVRFVVPLRNAAIAELHAGMVGYTLDRRLPASPPAETAALARRAAGAQVPLTALLNVYMVALAIYWEAIYDAIIATDAPPEHQTTVVRAGTRYLHQYIAQISGLAAAEYTDERDRALRRRMLDRAVVVRDVLSGARITEEILGYDLRDEHIGIAATGARAEEVLVRLRDTSGLRSLVVPGDDTMWAWVAGGADTVALAERAIASASTDSVWIGMGRPQRGVEGFRTTHRQALSAHALAIRLGRPVVRHEETALMLLVSQDVGAVRTFIADELGALLADERRGPRLLETLQAYLDSGQNGAATAAVLDVSARTVSHRLRLIEEALGRPVAGRAAELCVALRLRELLHSVS